VHLQILNCHRFQTGFLPAELINLPHYYAVYIYIYIWEVSETGDDSIFEQRGLKSHIVRCANNDSSEVIDILLPVTFYFNPSTRLDNVRNFWRFVISARCSKTVPRRIIIQLVLFWICNHSVRNRVGTSRLGQDRHISSSRYSSFVSLFLSCWPLLSFNIY